MILHLMACMISTNSCGFYLHRFAVFPKLGASFCCMATHVQVFIQAFVIYCCICDILPQLMYIAFLTTTDSPAKEPDNNEQGRSSNLKTKVHKKCHFYGLILVQEMLQILHVYGQKMCVVMDTCQACCFMFLWILFFIVLWLASVKQPKIVLFCQAHAYTTAAPGHTWCFIPWFAQAEVCLHYFFFVADALELRWCTAVVQHPAGTSSFETDPGLQTLCSLDCVQNRLSQSTSEKRITFLSYI